MIVHPIQAVLVGNPETPGTLELIRRIGEARSIQTIGALLKDIAGHLAASEPAPPLLVSALRNATRRKVAGARDVLAEWKQDKVKLFCGQSTPAGIRELAQSSGVDVGENNFKVFSTADPFAYLGTPSDKASGREACPEVVEGRVVRVIQGDVVEEPATGQPKTGQPKYDRPTCVVEALQVAFAARAHGAKRCVVVFSDSLDPSRHPRDPFAALVARLADGAGLDVEYASWLSRAPSNESSFARARMTPHRIAVARAISEIEQSDSLEAITASLSDLGAALLRAPLSARLRKEVAERLAQVLGERVSALAPTWLPRGVAITPPDADADADAAVVVFAGQSNVGAARDIARSLGASSVGQHSAEFQGGAPYVQLATGVRGRQVVVVQGSRQDPNTPAEERRSAPALLFEALLLCHEASKAGAASVQLVLLYEMNARTDKTEPGTGAYGELTANWIDGLDLAQLVLVEPHDPKVSEKFRKGNLTIVSGEDLLCADVLERTGRDNLALVSADKNGYERMRAVAKRHGIRILARGKKTRADHTERAKLESLGDEKAIAGRRFLLLEDEIATGSTAKQVVARLAACGAKEVHLAFAHCNMTLDPEKRHQGMRDLIELGPKGKTFISFLDTQPVGELPADLAPFVRVLTAAEAIAGCLSTLASRMIALYGLSGNPPTVAHRQIAGWAADLELKQKKVDEVWIAGRKSSISNAVFGRTP